MSHAFQAPFHGVGGYTSYNRGPPSRSPGWQTPNPLGRGQLQKHFLQGTKFGDLFGATSEAPEERFWGPFGGF